MKEENDFRDSTHFVDLVGELGREFKKEGVGVLLNQSVRLVRVFLSELDPMGRIVAYSERRAHSEPGRAAALALNHLCRERQKPP